MNTRLAIVDGRIRPSDADTLLSLGFKLIRLPAHKGLPLPLASHTDMLIARIGDEYFTYRDYYEANRELFFLLEDALSIKGGFTLCEVSPSDTYPRDAGMNLLVFGKILFIGKRTAPDIIIKRARDLGYRIIFTNQGYPACTVLKLTENAAVTADPGMARILSENGIETTFIENGGILLTPYEHGFIGGASGVFNGTVYLLGSLRGHTSQAAIEAAIKRAGLSAVELSEGELLDLGGILFTDGEIDEDCEYGNEDQPENPEEGIPDVEKDKS